MIDSYITPEKPHKFILSFFSSDSATSKFLIDNKYEFDVSTEMTDNHKAEINFENYQFDSLYVPFVILALDAEGTKYQSELYEVSLPYSNIIETAKGPSIFTICCFGGIIFGLPSPAYISWNGKSYFGLSKEISLLSYYDMGFNYPLGYVGLEYSYVFNAPVNNFLRIGYKQIFQLPVIEYVSPGLSGFSNFNGYNGLSPEISLGLFKIYNTFTIYTKYRYNFQPNRGDRFYHEISIGMYSSFFSIHL